MNSSKTMSSVMKKTTSSMMMTMIVTATAVRADLFEVEHSQFAPPMTPWSRISVIKHHIRRFNRYFIKRLMWLFNLKFSNKAPL
jgi:hypothetical protein